MNYGYFVEGFCAVLLNSYCINCCMIVWCIKGWMCFYRFGVSHVCLLRFKWVFYVIVWWWFLGLGGQANWGGNVYRFSEVFRFFGGEAEA